MSIITSPINGNKAHKVLGICINIPSSTSTANGTKLVLNEKSMFYPESPTYYTEAVYATYADSEEESSGTEGISDKKRAENESRARNSKYKRHGWIGHSWQDSGFDDNEFQPLEIMSNRASRSSKEQYPTLQTLQKKALFQGFLANGETFILTQNKLYRFKPSRRIACGVLEIHGTVARVSGDKLVVSKRGQRWVLMSESGVLNLQKIYQHTLVQQEAFGLDLGSGLGFDI